ncbi:MAG: hypothetical protein JO307_02185 [Bryobacterales bacterium]|nr:hypothetical protein [Bryobacterales bacterium]MBV9398693.1 hypothetical protein [Bryobacterales bacterium]
MDTLFRCLTVMPLVSSFCCAQPTSAVAGSITLASSGYQVPPAALDVAPGQLIVLHIHGIATTIPSSIAVVPDSSGFPHVLNGISVDLIQGTNATATALELRAIYQTHCLQPCSAVTGITLQIPFELESDFLAKGDPAPYLRISENGKAVGALSLRPVSDNIHVLNTCDDSQIYISAAVSVPQDICAPVVMVGGALNSLYNLAHSGDELAVWLYGMGAVMQQSTGCCVSEIPQPVQVFQLNFDYRPNAPASPVVPGFGVTAAPLFTGYVGTPYQLNFAVPPVPAGVPACDGVRIKSNLTVTITGSNSSDAAQICVLP